MKSTINLIWIPVSNLEKAVKYYTEVMGLELKELHPNFGWAELGGEEGARLGLSEAKSKADLTAGSNAVVTFSVKDIEAAKDELGSKGATLVGETMEVAGYVKLQMVTDSDGNQLQLVQLLY